MQPHMRDSPLLHIDIRKREFDVYYGLWKNLKNDSKRFMAFDYVPFDFQRGLCQINCGGVMEMPGLASNFEGAFG